MMKIKILRNKKKKFNKNNKKIQITSNQIRKKQMKIKNKIKCRKKIIYSKIIIKKKNN